MHIGYRGICSVRNQLLDAHLVFPAVAEVVLVKKAFIHSKVEIDQPDVPGVLRIRGTTQPRDAELFSVDAEAMKVIIGPSEGDLDDVVEIGNGIAGGDNESPPDHRVDAPNPHMNPVRRRTGSISHAASLTIGDSGRPVSKFSPRFVLVSVMALLCHCPWLHECNVNVGLGVGGKRQLLVNQPE